MRVCSAESSKDKQRGTVDFIFCRSVLFDGCLRLCVLGRLEMVAKIGFIFFLLSRGNSTQTDNLDEGKLSCQKHVDVQKRIELSISAKTTPKGMGYVI